ncbi:MAG: transcription factor IIA subunit alpha, partial [Candelina submexicana]
MTNASVGTIYTRVMQEVIESSQVDFEESGVDQQTLEELKETWQKKLSKLQVATFPWEPAPAATPIVNTPTVPSNVSQQHQPKPSPSPVPSIDTGGTRVKSDASNDGKPAISTIAQGNGGMNPQAAQQRAASLMQGRFGSQASKQVETLQAGLALQGQQRPQGSQAPAQTQTQSQPQSYHQYQNQQLQRQVEHQQNQQMQQQQVNSLNGAQTDGAGDAEKEWAAVMVRRNAAGEDEQMGTVHADRMMRRQLEAMGQRLEGGGLMVPLAERPKPAKISKRKSTDPATTPSLPSASSSSAPQVSRYDGGDESDDGNKLGLKDEEAKYQERDEDAINSDLDDPNAPISGDEEEEITQFMLCTYDKVQRVKNKWKCTLKDGVLM